jgi:hypothetical protein
MAAAVGGAGDRSLLSVVPFPLSSRPATRLAGGGGGGGVWTTGLTTSVRNWILAIASSPSAFNLRRMVYRLS